MRNLVLIVLAGAVASCGGVDIKDAQCPVAMEMTLDATWTDQCNGKVEGSLLEQNGEVVGGCFSTGNTKYACKFQEGQSIASICGANGIDTMTKNKINCQKGQHTEGGEATAAANDTAAPSGN